MLNGFDLDEVGVAGGAVGDAAGHDDLVALAELERLLEMCIRDRSFMVCAGAAERRPGSDNCVLWECSDRAFPQTGKEKGMRPL